jgi:hypothetical protein
MSTPGVDLFILYQMGASEEFTWFSVVGVFLSEGALRRHVAAKGITTEPELMECPESNEILLKEPREFLAVRSHEGEVPDVELAQ